MRQNELENAVSVTRDIYWLGFSEDISRLQCNPYLLLDGQDIILFDPGSIPDFPKVMRKVIDLVNPQDITWIVTSHQDPDVCGNLAVVEDVIGRPDLRIAAHTNTIRLIQHLGLRSEFYAVDKNDFSATLKSGRALDFVFLPYLHSPGAIGTYDRKNRALFSGDLFGALSRSQDLFDTEGFPQSMDSFHQAYMPNNQVLRNGVKRLESLDIKMILPQHGPIIEGDRVKVGMEHLRGNRSHPPDLTPHFSKGYPVDNRLDFPC